MRYLAIIGLVVGLVGPVWGGSIPCPEGTPAHLSCYLSDESDGQGLVFSEVPKIDDQTGSGNWYVEDPTFTTPKMDCLAKMEAAMREMEPFLPSTTIEMSLTQNAVIDTCTFNLVCRAKQEVKRLERLQQAEEHWQAVKTECGRGK